MPILTFILVIFFFFKESYGKEVCYSVEYYFIDVAEICIDFQEKNKRIYSKIKGETVGFVKLFKDIKYQGFSEANKNFRPKYFYFFQKEKSLKIIHEYVFEKNTVMYKKSKNNKTYRKEIKLTDKNIFEPFTAGYYLFKHIKEDKKGTLKIFFNGKIQLVRFDIKKSERKILLKPNVDIEGIIKPAGEWEMLFGKDIYPVEIKAKIRIGEIKIRRKN